jgi:hypothetical protein
MEATAARIENQKSRDDENDIRLRRGPPGRRRFPR